MCDCPRCATCFKFMYILLQFMLFLLAVRVMCLNSSNHQDRLPQITTRMMKRPLCYLVLHDNSVVFSMKTVWMKPNKECPIVNHLSPLLTNIFLIKMTVFLFNYFLLTILLLQLIYELIQNVVAFILIPFSIFTLFKLLQLTFFSIFSFFNQFLIVDYYFFIGFLLWWMFPFSQLLPLKSLPSLQLLSLQVI